MAFPNWQPKGRYEAEPLQDPSYDQTQQTEIYQTEILECEDIETVEVAPEDRAKGVGQMVAGGVVAAAGVPMLILPGPGVAAIAGGAVLAAKGYQKATGKEPPVDVEKAVYDTVDQVKDFAENKAVPAAKDFAENVAAPAAKKAGRIATEAGHVAVEAGKEFTEKVAVPMAKEAGRVAAEAGKAALNLGTKSAKAAFKAGAEAPGKKTESQNHPLQGRKNEDDESKDYFVVGNKRK